MDLQQHEHGVLQQMFDYFAGKHRVEAGILVRKPVSFCIEKIYEAPENLFPPAFTIFVSTRPSGQMVPRTSS